MDGQIGAQDRHHRTRWIPQDPRPGRRDPHPDGRSRTMQSHCPTDGRRKHPRPARTTAGNGSTVATGTSNSTTSDAVWMTLRVSESLFRTY